MKNKAFTLAEVLITLGIIGVVAAITIPNLIASYKAIKLKNQFKEAYSILSRAIKAYNGDDERISADMKDSNQNLYKTFLGYFQGTTDCGNSNQVKKDSEYCFIRTSNSGINKDIYYKNYALNNNFIDTSYLDDGQFYLMNGMLIAFNTSHQLISVSIDINGKKQKPNAWGHDVFTFQLKESEKEGGLELVPMGAPGTKFSNMNTYCSKKSNNSINGISCTYYAIQDSDYFKKLPK